MLKSKCTGLPACKLLCLLLISCFILTVFPTAYAADSQVLNVNIGSVSGQAGDSITIPVNFQGVGSSGINCFDFTLAYDSNTFEVVSVNPGGIIKNPDADFMEYTGGQGMIAIAFVDSTQGSKNILSNGLCMNIVLKIKSGAASGQYKIDMDTVGVFADKNLKKINTVFNPGTITVADSSASTPTGASTPTSTSTPSASGGGDNPGIPMTLKPSGTAAATATATSKPSGTTTPRPTAKVTPKPSAVVSLNPTFATPIIVIDENFPFLPAGIPADLVVNVSADKNLYTEGETISYTIRYLNRLNKAATNVVITAGIPENTTLLDGAGGTENGGNVEWLIGDLSDGKTGEIVYKVKIGQLSKPQSIVSNTVSIDSVDNVLINNDNKSTYNVMLYTNRFGSQSHKKYVEGYPDKTIRPDNEITRAEVAVMFAKILNLDVSSSGGQIYSDVPESHWAFKYVNAVSKAGLFKGYDGNIFKPNNSITRAELATAIFRDLKLEEVVPLETHFSDIVGHWAWGYVEEVYRLKLVSGYGNGLFLPDNKIKRSEVITMLNRMLYRGPLKGVSLPFTDLSEKHWAYGQIAESAVDHEYTISPDGYEMAVNPNQ